MNIHEYQGKELFRKYGVATPRGFPAFSVDEAVDAAKKLGGPVWVVKAQIHAGGRGKGGGVKLARSIDEVRDIASKMLGMTLVTHQTGPHGRVVRRLLVEEGADIKKELYVAMVVDRVLQKVVMMASSEGGMDIEEVADKHPEKIHRVTADPFNGLADADAEGVARKIGVPEALVPAARDLFKSLFKCFDECDCSLVEVNPLIVTRAGKLVALDAKINIDANALFRHADLAALRDPEQEDPLERRAAEHELNYVSLDGDIACMVNGAGLAMATMDLIQLHGGHPANFLDVGGGATAERVAIAFEIIFSNPKVRAVLINIFGGIVRCDIIAAGVVQAVRAVGVKLPVVVRLEGTNAVQARAILAASGLAITPAADLTDAARKVIALAKKAAP